MSELLIPTLPRFDSKIENIHTDLFAHSNEIVVFIVIALYFLPFFFAWRTKKHNLSPIFICNLLLLICYCILGFTVLIAWLVLLCWVIMELENKPTKPAAAIAKECPFCKELLRAAATVCHRCQKTL